jgi:DNA topoisomerase-2
MGAARKTSDTTIEITELPIHKWTRKFVIELEEMMEKGESIIEVNIERYVTLN